MKSLPKHVVITGVSTGIGRATAQTLLRKGYQVFGSVRTDTDADRLRQELGAGFTPLIFDVTSQEAIAEAARLVADRLAGSGLGGLINNAGMAIAGPLQLQPIEVIRQHFEVNVLGLIQATQAFLPLLGARSNHPVPPGRIINVSSVGGQIAGPFIGAYHGTKFALEGMSHTLRRELQVYGVDVIVVGPGSVNTPIWDKGVDAQPYANTVYGAPMRSFVDYFVSEGKKGDTPEHMAAQLVRVLETPRPGTRYAFVAGKLQNWILPRLLPARLLDRIIGKSVGLLPGK